MAKVFLDTNYFIDILGRKAPLKIVEPLNLNYVFVSSLSYHILFYTYKIKVPSKKFEKVHKNFEIVGFTREILEKSLFGPTKDLEDNIQLHSAAEADCRFLLTNDKKLLRLKFFGKTQILNSLPELQSSS